jgi:hypothetical protein
LPVYYYVLPLELVFFFRVFPQIFIYLRRLFGFCVIDSHRNPPAPKRGRGVTAAGDEQGGEGRQGGREGEKEGEGGEREKGREKGRKRERESARERRRTHKILSKETNIWSFCVRFFA